MFRKLVLLLTVMALLLVGAAVSADPVNGCYATASETTVVEGGNLTVTVQCDNIPTSNNVFGFQISTTPAGDLVTGLLPAAYTAGTFSDASTGATSGVVVGVNSLSGLYGVTRRSTEVVSETSFTLGSYPVTALQNLTTDGAITITLNDSDFMLSNNNGQALTGWLRDVNDVTVTVTDVDLAWLTGQISVKSDSTAIANAAAIDLALGDKTYSATNVASYTYQFTMDDTHRYSEVGNPASDNTLTISASADMSGHLACSSSLNLGDTGSAINVTTLIGSAGEITLLAGDSDNDGLIDIDDATLIGANFGTTPNGERDVNGDTAINILDLVHVGRNYNSVSGSCGTGA